MEVAASPPSATMPCSSAARVVVQNYQHALSMIFAIDEVNKNARFLPNVTLGYKIYDNLFDSMGTYETITDLLFTGQRDGFNYDSVSKKDALSVIGGLTEEYAIQMANVLNIYKIPQLTYTAYETTLNSKVPFPSLYRMAPKETTLHMGIVQLLLYFNWRWIGLIVSDNDDGERFVQILTPMLVQNFICVAYLHRARSLNNYFLNDYMKDVPKINATIVSAEINVIIVSGDSQSLFSLTFVLVLNEFETKTPLGKVWITPPQWDFTQAKSLAGFCTETFQGALSFSLHTNEVPGFRNFLQTLKSNEALMHFLCLFWQFAFKCRLPNGNLENFQECTGEERLENLPESWFEMDMTGQSYSIYNAVYAVAHALQEIHLSKQRTLVDRSRSHFLNVQPWQLHSFLKNAHFNNGAGHEFFFQNGEISAGYDIINWVTFSNQSFHKVWVGKISPREECIINGDIILWNSRFKQMQIIVSSAQKTNIQARTMTNVSPSFKPS
ncbi:vomeronasal type-2 receptor 26-like [Rhineura floridana]|uniref:vomeronasal type-2 receptor 26-like n=1 Tax=Rhineura floridana TaxID=261503 RepID=UPI002AC877EE|nr:vomeronasal type-2 receptor 26-like [Rhineura floridana]